ncbi:integral membrane protein [Colletotrichum tofieldiae]|nr:integral membrane protein [Colletotrichum tofieldiae]
MEDRSGQVLAVAVLFFVLCWIAVGLRIYCRGWIIRSLGVDDKLMIGLMLIFTVYLITQIQGVRYGTGRHRIDLSPEHNRDALMYWYICELLYIISTCLLKISVGYFLLRVSVRRTHIWILRVLMLGTVLFGSTYFFMTHTDFLEQSPRAEGKCFSNRVVLIMTYTASIINCLADWAFGILPLFIVWSLSLPKRTRFLAFGILSFAAIGSAATVIRSVYIPTLLDGDDFLWATTDVALWSTVEPGIGITAASIATLRPLWQLIWYRAGLRSQAPRAIAWRERFQGKPSYIRSDGSDPRQHPRNPMSDDAALEEIEAEPHTGFEADLPRIHHTENGLSPSTHSRRSGLSKNFDISSGRNKPSDDRQSLVIPARMAVALNGCAPHPARGHEIELEDGVHLTPVTRPNAAPTVDWCSPRMSALSMGFNSLSRNSTQSAATTWGFVNCDGTNRISNPGLGDRTSTRASRLGNINHARNSRASRLSNVSSISDVRGGHIDTYRVSGITTNTYTNTNPRNSRLDRYSRTTRASSHYTNGSQYLAPPASGDFPMPNPPPSTWQVSVPTGMNSAQWLSSRMAEHPGYPGPRR